MTAREAIRKIILNFMNVQFAQAIYSFGYLTKQNQQILLNDGDLIKLLNDKHIINTRS